MNDRDDWIAETVRLIRLLESDSLQRAEGRLLAAQQAVESVKRQIDALHVALRVYREHHGVPEVEQKPTQQQLDPYFNKGTREMLERWAADHDGQIVMRDAANFFISAGFFRDYTQAAGTLYPTILRHKRFTKISRGMYRQAAGRTSAADGGGE